MRAPRTRCSTVLRDNHQAYADVLAGLLGRQAPGERDDALYDELVASFEVTDVAAAGRDRLRPRVDARRHAHRAAAVSSRASTGPAIASILIVEARHCAVLADLAGHGDDLDALFVNDAEPLAVERRTGG